MKKNENLIVNLTFYAKFEALVEGEIIQDVKQFQTENDIILESTDLSTGLIKYKV